MTTKPKRKFSILGLLFTTAPGYNYLKEIWIHKLTPAGKIWLFSMSLSALAGMITLTVPIYKLFLAMMFMYFYCSVTAFLFRPRLSLKGEIPRQVSAQQEIMVSMEVENCSSFPVFDLSISLFSPPASFVSESIDNIPSLKSGEKCPYNLQFKPLKRGVYNVIDVRGYSTFPFNFSRYWTGTLITFPITVLPLFYPLDGVVLSSVRKYQPGGVALTSNIGESPEYIGNREYRQGDQIKKIDFKSWARHGKPVVREFQEEYFNRIALVLDTYIPPGKKKPRDGFLNFEAAVSLTASIADKMASGEFIVDVFAAGPELYHFKSGRHITHFDSILEILACIDETRVNPFDTISPKLTEEIRQISSTICIFLDWDVPHENMLRAINESGSTVKLFIIRDGKTSIPWENASELCESVVLLDPSSVLKGGLGMV